MIKNVIFDMGNVLIEWEPVLFLRRFGLKNEEDIQLILDNTVRKSHWHEYDLGQISTKELVQKCCENVPKRLKKYAKMFAIDWPSVSKQIDGMVEYTHYLQDKGYKIYVLSNAGRNQPYYIRNYPYSHFDGACISAFYGVAKPEREFYETLLKKYNLKAEECVFTDDMKKNVEGAKAVGINAYVFENIEKLKEDLGL